MVRGGTGWPLEMRRDEFLDELSRRVVQVRPGEVALVAIDGVDGAGKTTLARELSARVEGLGRPIVAISIDAFHHPAEIRYQRGRESGEGYYRDSFDLERFRAFVLDPLEAGGTGAIRTIGHDLQTDASLEPEPVPVPVHALVLTEGVFLHRPELRSAWHFSLFLRTTFEVTVGRAVARDGGDPAEIRARYERRYVAGQRLYLEEADPMRHADWVVEHDDPARPRVLRR